MGGGKGAKRGVVRRGRSEARVKERVGVLLFPQDSLLAVSSDIGV